MTTPGTLRIAHHRPAMPASPAVQCRRVITILPMCLLLGACPIPDGTEPLPCLSTNDVDSARCALRHALGFLWTEQAAEDSSEGRIRLAGEWPSFLRWLPVPPGRGNVFHDSNAFVPLCILSPLSRLDDSALPVAARHISTMQEQAAALILRHYLTDRGRVNFWPTLDGFHGPPQMRADLPHLVERSERVFDIADDVDDTALTHALLPRFSSRAGLSTALGASLSSLAGDWTDGPGRPRVHAAETWKPRGSGAFMTWLGDELNPDHKLPLWPVLPNTVDCVVMVNVLWALGGADGPSVNGYTRTCDLARDVMRNTKFPRCSHYYPTHWMFPYVVARALTDGANSCLATEDSDDWPLRRMIQTVLDGQGSNGAWEDDTEPARAVHTQHRDFDGDGRALSTALAVSTLYQLRGTANLDADMVMRMDQSAARGIGFLLRHAWRGRDGPFHHWRGGVVFSSSVSAVALWKSPAFTTALVLDAMLRRVLLLTGGNPALDFLPVTTADVPEQWLQQP